MKRILGVILILCMSFLIFAGCGGDPGETTGGSGAASTTEGTTQSQQTTAGTTGETTQPRAMLELNRDDITLVTKGEILDLYDGDIDPSLITWESKDESVATFTDGIVTAVAKGETEVTATYAGQTATCIVRCNLKQTTSTQEPTQPTQDSPVSTGGKRDPVKQPPATQTVDASFFDDAVFIGDSISLKLSYYAASSGELGKAKFLVVGSYGVANAINDHPDTKLSYQGTTYTDFEKALAATGGKKLFVMLGMNDIGLYGIDGTITNWGKFLEMVRSACPDMKIYIQSMTPVWTGGEKGGLKNSNVDAYNAKLKTFAESNGCTFIDVAPYMKDSTGGLATVYCSDSFVNLTTEGAEAWVKVLRAFSGY